MTFNEGGIPLQQSEQLLICQSKEIWSQEINKRK